MSLRVLSVTFTASARLPLTPQLRTYRCAALNDIQGQTATHAVREFWRRLNRIWICGLRAARAIRAALLQLPLRADIPARRDSRREKG